MAFPATSAFEDFSTAADENPLSDGGNFAGPIIPGDGTSKLSSHQAVAVNGSSYGETYWATSFSGAHEVWAAIGGTSQLSYQPYVAACIQSPNTSSNAGYVLWAQSTTQIQLRRFVSGASGAALASYTSGFTLAAGDAWGMHIEGGVISCYVRVSGTWSLLGTVSDSTYTSGYVGFGWWNTAGATVGFTSFGGGNSTTPANITSSASSVSAASISITAPANLTSTPSASSGTSVTLTAPANLSGSASAVSAVSATVTAGTVVVVTPVSGVGVRSLREMFPFRLLIGSEDCTFLLSNGFTFSSVDPGGFEMCSLNIPKDMPNTLRGQTIRIDSGLHVAWEGRVSEVQRSLGNQTTITGEGNGAVLADLEAAEIFVDRDLTYWTGPSVQRQLNLVSGGFAPGGPQVAVDASNGNPSLAMTGSGPWASNANGGQIEIEALYDALGIPIGSVYVAWDFNSLAAGSFLGELLLATSDTLGTNDNGGAFSTTTGSQTVTATTSNRVFACLLFQGPSTAGGQNNAQYILYFQNLAVYGKHGLSTQGSTPGGFYPSQIAGWAVGQTSKLQPGTIPDTDATGYVLPHSVYRTAVPLNQIIDDMAKAAGWHWGVWESPTPLTGDPRPRLDFRPRPVQGEWAASCRRADCETCDVREALSGMYDTAIINYTSIEGLKRSVTVTADNPVLDLAGVHRTVELNGGTMTSAAASTFGQIALNLLYTQARVAGSIVIPGVIDNRGPYPAWLLKPGIDRLRIIDLPSTDAFGIYNDVPLTRMECSGSTDGFKTSLEVGQGGNLVETLQSRLTAVATLAGQGGA